jgi:DNA polymerase-3 subunit epsilon
VALERILAVDTETCALGGGRDRVVQFCVAELDLQLQERARWTQLVNPGRPIPPMATAVHGITDAMVADAPRFAELAPRLRPLFGPRTVFMAYNAGFDLGVLNLEFQRAGVPALPDDLPVLDPLQVERAVTSRSLGPTYTRYTGQVLENAHTADADVAAMVEVLRRQRQAHADKLPADVLGLVGWPPPRTRTARRGHLYEDDAGVVRLGFGKHAGRAAREVPAYLAWMLEEDFPERTKRAARRVLQESTLHIQLAGRPVDARPERSSALAVRAEG